MMTSGLNEATFSTTGEHYKKGAEELLQRLLPRGLLDPSPDDSRAASIQFDDMLPILRVQLSGEKSSPPSEPTLPFMPDSRDPVGARYGMSLLLLCKSCQGTSHFFYEMVSRWLLPHKKVDVELFFTSDIRLPRLSEELLHVAEIAIQVNGLQDFEEIQRNIKQIEMEIRLGVVSQYHARRILEFKGLAIDGKVAMIHEKIGSLIQSRSKDFERGIFSQMQRFLVTCREEFKNERDYHHISRMISNFYCLRKLLRQNPEEAARGREIPGRRQVLLKFLKTRLRTKNQVTGFSGREDRQRHVLGILAGMNFLLDNERFESEHFFSAVRRVLPHVRVVENSFFFDAARDSFLRVSYLEIEREDGVEFSQNEIQLLKCNLPESIEASIERLAHSIFMPRNEEEVLRNIMILAGQLRFVSDMPQAIVSFDEQRLDELRFTVILVRVLSSDSKGVHDLIAAGDGWLRWTLDRVRHVGSLGKKCRKEALVFRVAVNGRGFLREDHSIDLYKARQCVLSEISKKMGGVRDYNGGMLDKQHEVLDRLRTVLGRISEQNSSLLEKFFFSLAPVELRSIMDVEQLERFFLLLIQVRRRALSKKKRSEAMLRKETGLLFIVISHIDETIKEKLLRNLSAAKLPAHQLISFFLEMPDMYSAGFLFHSKDSAEQDRFLNIFSGWIDPIRQRSLEKCGAAS